MMQFTMLPGVAAWCCSVVLSTLLNLLCTECSLLFVHNVQNSIAAVKHCRQTGYSAASRRKSDWILLWQQQLLQRTQCGANSLSVVMQSGA